MFQKSSKAYCLLSFSLIKWGAPYLLRCHKILRGTVKCCRVYSASEEVVKPNRSPIKLSLWSARYLTRWMNGGSNGVHPCPAVSLSPCVGKRKQDKVQRVFIFTHTVICLPPCRYFLWKVCSRVWGWLRSLLPRFLLPLVGSDLCWPSLPSRVVLSSGIKVWTSTRYRSHHGVSAQIKPQDS